MTSSISAHHPTASLGTSGHYFYPVFLDVFYLDVFAYLSFWSTVRMETFAQIKQKRV
jgi:hypothetical protein